MKPLSKNIEENIDRFLAEVIASGVVWGLEGEEGWAVCPSERNSELDVMPFWSQQDFAQCHCVEDWAVYKPVAIDLEEFLEDWLPGMHTDVILVGVNWDDELEGSELEPLDVLEAIEEEMS